MYRAIADTFTRIFGPSEEGDTTAETDIVPLTTEREGPDIVPLPLVHPPLTVYKIVQGSVARVIVRMNVAPQHMQTAADTPCIDYTWLRPDVKLRAPSATVTGLAAVGSDALQVGDQARRIRGGEKPAAFYNKTFSYALGETAVARHPNGAPVTHFAQGCGAGIHFFVDVDSALNYMSADATHRSEFIISQ